MPDFDRPLNDRGRRDAPRMGKLIAGEHGVPDLVLCSAARRAVETYMELAREWTAWPALRTDVEFYACNGDVWLNALRALPDDLATVMIVGHMPELYDMLSTLVGADNAPERFPTAALGILECGGPWSELGSSVCRLASFQIPTELRW